MLGDTLLELLREGARSLLIATTAAPKLILALEVLGACNYSSVHENAPYIYEPIAFLLTLNKKQGLCCVCLKIWIF